MQPPRDDLDHRMNQVNGGQYSQDPRDQHYRDQMNRRERDYNQQLYDQQRYEFE